MMKRQAIPDPNPDRHVTMPALSQSVNRIPPQAIRFAWGLILLGLLGTFLLPVWGEGENDPLWRRNGYSKKVYTIGHRILQRNGIPQKISFRVDYSRNTVNAGASDAQGQVLIYSGLLYLIESDDELAYVLGHEIAHVLMNHGRSAKVGEVTRHVLITGPMTVVGAMGGLGGAYLMNKAGRKINKAFSNGQTRGQELDADEMGLDLMVKAGYDPYAALSIGNKIFSDGNATRLWRSHPMGSHRLERLEAMIESRYGSAVQTVSAPTTPNPETTAAKSPHKGQGDIFSSYLKSQDGMKGTLLFQTEEPVFAPSAPAAQPTTERAASPEPKDSFEGTEEIKSFDDK